MIGECDIGCNEGAKNSLDFNYLSAAKRGGAEIRTLAEVRTFAPHDGGWRVDYVRHDAERAGRKTLTRGLPLQTITADRLILSAGTFGTTFLMHKNLPGVSPMLGRRFSGNGDLLTMALDATVVKDGRRRPLLIDASRGPSIAAAIRFPDGPDGRGFYLEDVGYPGFADWVIEATDSPSVVWRARRVVWRLLLGLFGRDRDTDIGGEIAAALGAAHRSSSLMPLGGMGRDAPDGELVMADNKLTSTWRIDRSAPYFKRVRSEMEKYILVSLYTDGEGEVYERQQQYQQDTFQTVALPFYAILDSDGTALATFPGLTRDQDEFIKFLIDGQSE